MCRYAVVFLFFVTFAQAAVAAIQAFSCVYVGDPDGTEYLAADMSQICPSQDTGGFIYVYSVIMIIAYPVGLPLLLILVLQLSHVPSLAYDMGNTARLKGLLDICGMNHAVNFNSCFLQNLLKSLGDDEYSQKLDPESKAQKDINALRDTDDHDKQEKQIEKMLDARKWWELHARLLRQFCSNPDIHHELEDLITKISGLQKVEKFDYSQKMKDFITKGGIQAEGDLFEQINTDMKRFNHDCLMDLANYLMSKDRLAIPAVGWVSMDGGEEGGEEEQNKQEHSDVIGAGAPPEAEELLLASKRSIWSEMKAMIQSWTGSTDIAFVSDALFRLTKKKALQRVGFLFDSYEVRLQLLFKLMLCGLWRAT